MSGPYPRKRREPLELQLTAMIDIFSMIVIFLILGTVFGAADIVVPSNLTLPKSVSKENVDSAPTVAISHGVVTTSLQPGPLDLAYFTRSTSGASSPELSALKTQLRAHIKKMPKDKRGSGALLNVIADRDTPYRTLFDVIRFFRESGFDALLFVATGETSVADGK